MSLTHLPVLIEPVLAHALPPTGRVFADLTFGLGGHTRALLQRYPQIETVIGLDRDGEILEAGRQLWDDPRIIRVHARSSDLPARLQALRIPTVDGILLDLGVSSPQFDLAERGFAFSHDGPLDMRMDRSQATTAADLVATLAEEELVDIFHRYGEERFSRRIARTIVQQRESAPIRTTRELAALVAKSVPGAFSHAGRIHPATRVFQALRIAVNDELEELQRTLAAVEPCLAPEGRLSVISFHSLEDRIVKRFFAERSRDCICPPGLPICCCHHQATFTLLTRKPVEADPQEIAANPRSRSARLRVGIRLASAAAIEEEA